MPLDERRQRERQLHDKAEQRHAAPGDARQRHSRAARRKWRRARSPSVALATEMAQARPSPATSAAPSRARPISRQPAKNGAIR